MVGDCGVMYVRVGVFLRWGILKCWVEVFVEILVGIFMGRWFQVAALPSPTTSRRVW